jgi:hyperosmotically inducible protein
MKDKIGLVLIGALLSAPMLALADTASAPAQQALAQKVRHELLLLPFYNVFDNLTFEVEGNRVVLTGEVTRPVVKLDAGTAVHGIPGVKTVVNNIEVLPVSPFDNHLRFELFRAIYWRPALSRYGWGTQPSIRIIVKNGHVTLDGVVNSKTDRDLAGIYANGVPGVFSVTNHLRVVKS